MKTIEATAAVTADGRLVLETQAPTDILPGQHRVIVWLDESMAAEQSESLQDFPVIDLGPWPEDLSLRRGEMYGDEGR